MLSRESIYDLSRKYSISVPTITEIMELIFFRDKLEGIELNLSVEKYLQSLKTPQDLYSIRINIGINSNITSRLESSEEFNNLILFDKQIPNVAYLKSQGPFTFKKLSNSVTIDRFAAESVMIGANLYIPGFLPQKNLYKFKKGDHVSIFSPGNAHVANGETCIDAKDLNDIKKGIGIRTIESVYKLPSYRDSEYFISGNISDMGFAPLMACWAIMSKYTGEEKILDLCSAPGHKTCTLSEIGQYLNDGNYPVIVSLDRSKKRLETLIREILRLKLKNITIHNLKLQKLGVNHPELKGNSDLVILDPPCSALGTCPKLFIEISRDEFRSYFLLQRSFLKIADEFIKPGGLLLYNTCTTTVLENEGITFYAIDRLGYKLISITESFKHLFPNRFFELLKNNVSNAEQSHTELGYELNSGLSKNDINIDSLVDFYGGTNEIPIKNNQHYEDIEKYCRLNENQAKKVIRTYPSPNTNGYYMALFQKP